MYETIHLSTILEPTMTKYQFWQDLLYIGNPQAVCNARGEPHPEKDDGAVEWRERAPKLINRITSLGMLQSVFMSGGVKYSIIRW